MWILSLEWLVTSGAWAILLATVMSSSINQLHWPTQVGAYHAYISAVILRFAHESRMVVYYRLPRSLRTLRNGDAIVATVRATNAVGLVIKSSSQVVTIGDMDPRFVQPPALASIFNNSWTLPGYSPSGQAVKVTWEGLKDMAVEYRLRLVSNDGSESPISRELGEFASDGAVLTNLKLHDGSSYTALGKQRLISAQLVWLITACSCGMFHGRNLHQRFQLSIDGGCLCSIACCH